VTPTALTTGLPAALHVATADLATGPDLVALRSRLRDPDSFTWLRPDGDDSILTWGRAAHWSPRSGGHDFASARRFVDDVRRHLSGFRSVVVGGFSFAGDTGRGDPGPSRGIPAWSAFGSGHLTVPAVQVVRRDSRWTVTSIDPDPLRARRQLTGALELIEEVAASPRNAGPRGTTTRGCVVDGFDPRVVDTTADHFTQIVARAVTDIASGRLEKVVLARSVELIGRIDLDCWLARLRDRFPSCAVFAHRIGPVTFFGASPERLVSVNGRTVETSALAGSRPRGPDPDSDRVLAEELWNSVKEQNEHRFAVKHLRDGLRTAGVELDPDRETEVLRIPGIQHLHTPITGTRPAGVGILDLVESLHPSPAVAGTPTPAALEWISRHEGLDRGWYTAPIGWLDTEGEGEFRVGLRSAVHSSDTDTTTLFAGGGIVGRSVPTDELAETRTKLGALLDVLPR